MPAKETFDPHVVALDAQALREGAWPRPNAKLRQLREVAAQFGPHFWVIQGAVDEVRGWRERNANEAAAELARAAKAARRSGLTANAQSSGLEEMLAVWDHDHVHAVEALSATVIPFTQRPPE